MQSSNPPAPPAAPSGPGISPGQALQRLLDGNKRYAGNRTQHADDPAARRLALATAQHPFACILGCADSRVPVELVFDQGLGDLFVVRVAGNIAADTTVLASIEFAVAEIGVPLVVVLGHEGCGAVAATLAALQGTAVPGHLDALVRAIRPAVAASGHGLGDALDNVVRANVSLVTRGLRESDPLLRPAVQAGRLQIVGARYNLTSGLVDVIA